MRKSLLLVISVALVACSHMAFAMTDTLADVGVFASEPVFELVAITTPAVDTTAVDTITIDTTAAMPRAMLACAVSHDKPPLDKTFSFSRWSVAILRTANGYTHTEYG